MKRIEISLDGPMFQELQAASRENGLSPHSWACEAIESVLATRRLPRVVPSASRPRMAETMMRSRAEVESRAAGPLKAGEIPTTDELDCLADIT